MLRARHCKRNCQINTNKGFPIAYCSSHLVKPTVARHHQVTIVPIYSWKALATKHQQKETLEHAQHILLIGSIAMMLVHIEYLNSNKKIMTTLLQSFIRKDIQLMETNKVFVDRCN